MTTQTVQPTPDLIGALEPKPRRDLHPEAVDKLLTAAKQCVKSTPEWYAQRGTQGGRLWTDQQAHRLTEILRERVELFIATEIGQPIEPKHNLKEIPTHDARGYKRAEHTLPGHRAGIPAKTRGRRYPADPPTAAEIFALLSECDDTPTGMRLKALIGTIWRSGLRINEALALVEADLNPPSVTVRSGKGNKRRVSGMDPFGWQVLMPWVEWRREHLPPGPIFCVTSGATAGRGWHHSDVRACLHKLAKDAGVRKRCAPHQFRHALATEMAAEGVPVHLISRQLGHSNIGTTSTYLEGVRPEAVIEAVHERRAPSAAVPDLMAMVAAGRKVAA